MAGLLFMRFESQSGGVSLFLNGFLLFGPEDTGRATSQVAPFIRSGVNSVELVSERPGAQARFAVADLADGNPETAPILLEGQIFGAQQRSAHELTLDGDMPVFAWLEAQSIDDIDMYRQPLFEIAKSLAAMIERGPDDRLLDVLGLKHAEIAMAAGISKPEMDEGLLGGLAELRAVPVFRVDLAEYVDFLPVLGSNHQIVSLRRRSGGDAIRIIDGMDNPGFSVSVALIRERWQIVR